MNLNAAIIRAVDELLDAPGAGGSAATAMPALHGTIAASAPDT